MRFIVLFEDNPGTGVDVRVSFMPEHLAFLERHAGEIEVAGPLLDQDDAMAGGIWVVDAPGRDAVRTLVEEDPFWPTGLRKSVRILKWTQVFAHGKRLS